MDKTSLCGEQNIFMPIDKTFFYYRQNYCPATATRASRMVMMVLLFMFIWCSKPFLFLL